MSFVQLGKSGLKVSRICLGTMIFGQTATGCDEAVARTIIDAYLDAGHNFIDTADIYVKGESESIIGRTLGRRRKNTVLATKAFWAVEEGVNNNGSSRKHLIEACENSLRRLQTDYIDLYYVHIWDPLTPLEETLAALHCLVEQGKVRYLGVSDFTGWQVSEAMAISRHNHWNSFICHQIEYSLLVRDMDIEIAPASRYNGLGLVAWSPLAGGMLSGKYSGGRQFQQGTRFGADSGQWWKNRFDSASNWKASVEFVNIAEETSLSPVSLAIAYSLLPEGMASTIIGPRYLHQLWDNLKGEEIAVSSELRARLDALRPPFKPFPHPQQEDAFRLRN